MPWYVCPKCGNEYQSMGDKRRHINFEHSDEDSK